MACFSELLEKAISYYPISYYLSNFWGGKMQKGRLKWTITSIALVILLVLVFYFVKIPKERKEPFVSNFSGAPVIEIEMGIEDLIIFYKEKNFLEKEESEELLENFKKSLRGVEAKNCFIESGENFTSFSCEIHGAKKGSWYEFEWFLQPRGLDFLDTPFQKEEKSLSWEGKFNNATTSIIIRFPYPIKNCHAHVWRK